MTDRELCTQKAKALADELSARYGTEFRYMITGSDECFDIVKHGAPYVYISGGIHSDLYYLTMWVTETSKYLLTTSGSERLPKSVMIAILDKFIDYKAPYPAAQMELF